MSVQENTQIGLNPTTLSSLPPTVAIPSYNRNAITPGIVHLCVGNFHRAHQALYIDKLLRHDFALGKDWGITGIGVLDFPAERSKAASMASQHGLYTLTECPPDAERSVRVVGSITQYIHAPDDYASAMRALTAPTTRIVSMTITEGGYNTNDRGEFNLAAPFIQEDLLRDQPQTVFGLMTEALAIRRQNNIAPFTILSCDNLQHNGQVAKTAVLSFARAKNADVADWIEQNVSFPSCMVDRITPATLPADRDELNRASGVNDEIPVFAESFTQWVIEDNFCQGRPPLEHVGVQFTSNVNPYEAVKLRMLNATHTMLALPAFVAKIGTVAEAMNNSLLQQFVHDFLFQDVIPLLTEAPMPTETYATMLIARFSNTAIQDQILRIVSDSSSKLSVFFQLTANGLDQRIQDGQLSESSSQRLAFMFACYIRYVTDGISPQATFRLQEPALQPADRIMLQSEKDIAAIVRNLSPAQGWTLITRPAFVSQVVKFHAALETRSVESVLEEINHNKA